MSDDITVRSLFEDLSLFDPYFYEKEIKCILDSEREHFDTCVFAAIKRKGFTLFSPFFNEQEFTHCSIQKNHSENLFVISSKTPISSGKYIILTDAINTGKEILDILTLKSIGEKVIKVCGLVARYSTLELLRKQYPSIEFKIRIVVNNDDEYFLHHKRLQKIYHNRMMPLDSDHPITTLKISTDVPPDEIWSLIKDAISHYHKEAYIWKANDLAIENKSSFTADFENIKSLVGIDLYLDPNFVIIERPKLRFKYDPEKQTLRIEGIVLCQVKTTEEFIKTKLELGICSQNYENKLCNGYKNGLTYKVLVITCPKCADWNISRNIIDKFLFSFSEICETNGIEIIPA